MSRRPHLLEQTAPGTAVCARCGLEAVAVLVEGTCNGRRYFRAVKVAYDHDGTAVPPETITCTMPLDPPF